jgi:hypothetical protein
MLRKNSSVDSRVFKAIQQRESAAYSTLEQKLQALMRFARNGETSLPKDCDRFNE